MINSPEFINLPEKTTFRPDEVATFLSVSRRTIYRMIQSGRLPGFRVHGSVRISRQALLMACHPHL